MKNLFRRTTPAPATEPWPNGVIARYLTLASATVDIHDNETAACTGCGNDLTLGAESALRAWAQTHAEKCRALPRWEVAP
ncbi:hypothetical protein [Streptomyces aidingensis]|uniref:Uncharacterized protein n=1 Tax=Streptomyces aidingensis TaxID=910347 RepID=A0A1I1Q6X5_9ACTN|nr:hypothetical protein [Streptomyces aidingensis]SFD13860.1 hypothetical protein SAMN05421773_11080 [Streptomyces aidingensis]